MKTAVSKNEIPVSKNTQQALFTSWRESIIKRATPYRYSSLYTKVKPVDNWWLHWLLHSITTKEKGHTWFRQQIIEWLEKLPGEQTQLGEEYSVLHLLTKDLTEIKYQEKSECQQMKFLSNGYQISRRTHVPIS